MWKTIKDFFKRDDVREELVHGTKLIVVQVFVGTVVTAIWGVHVTTIGVGRFMIGWIFVMNALPLLYLLFNSSPIRSQNKS